MLLTQTCTLIFAMATGAKWQAGTQCIFQNISECKMKHMFLIGALQKECQESWEQCYEKRAMGVQEQVSFKNKNMNSRNVEPKGN